MKEIGGYFQLESFEGKEYYSSSVSLNSVRSAILYVIKSKKYSTIYLPYFLCDSIEKKMTLEGVNTKFYYIDEQYLPILNENIEVDECILVVNYFGLLSDEIIYNIYKNYHNVIIDNTQAFFQKPLCDIDTVYSCRKYFGVPDGAYLFTNTRLDEELLNEVTYSRMEHLLGRLEFGAKEFYSVFQRNEEHFAGTSIKKMSLITHNILSGINYERIKKNRTRNFNYLNNSLKCINMLKLTQIDGAFAYPLMIEDGEHLRNNLIQDYIYIPTLWRNVIDSGNKDSFEYNLAKNIISIPCDQRYTEEDMQYIIDKIYMYLKL